MTKKIAQICIFLSCVGILLFGVLVKPHLFSPPKKENRPDYLFENIQLKEFVRGQKTMDIVASKASYDRDLELLRMSALTAVFFAEDQTPFHLVSPDAGLQLTTGAIFLYHPIIKTVLSDVGMKIRATNAVWHSREGDLRASGNIRVLRGRLSVSSEAMHMDQARGRVTFSGRAKAQWIF